MKTDSQNDNRNDELHSLNVEGTEYITRFTRKFPPQKKWSRPDRKKVLAFIPGTIQKVFVRSGQVVREGDTLVILEAMKMRNQVKAEFSGKIRLVNVTEGEVVPKAHLIIEFE